MRLFYFGMPGGCGGANTEMWHTLRMFRERGVVVGVIPTWGEDREWESRLKKIGCSIYRAKRESLSDISELRGAVAMSMCNSNFFPCVPMLRDMGCKIVWSNAMTFSNPDEVICWETNGPADAYHFQSQYQRNELEKVLANVGYRPEMGHTIRGAFYEDEFPFAPRPYGGTAGPDFYIGRMARPDHDKWSSNLWSIYGRVQYRHRKAEVMGVSENTQSKLGKTPPWAKVFRPSAMSARDFLGRLHCYLTVNGGARENWPRVGLEAMSAGVPIVAQDKWGWKEMIVHGETGFLGGCDEEMAHYTATLAYDDRLRMRIAENARDRLVSEIANMDFIWFGWGSLFSSIGESP